MKWDLRAAAERRRIWRSKDMQKLLAEHGLEICKAKMSQLWTGNLSSIRLDDLDIICTALDCSVDELLVHTSPLAPAPVVLAVPVAPLAYSGNVRPKRLSGRIPPP